MISDLLFKTVIAEGRKFAGNIEIKSINVLIQVRV